MKPKDINSVLQTVYGPAMCSDPELARMLEDVPSPCTLPVVTAPVYAPALRSISQNRALAGV